MPYSLIKENPNEPRYPIRFRGAAMIPRINQMAPCRVELTMRAITEVMESLYRHPLRLEVFYVDPNKREWEINFMNYKKILPSAPVKKIEEPQVEIVEEYNPFPTKEEKVQVEPTESHVIDEPIDTDDRTDDGLESSSTEDDVSMEDQKPSDNTQTRQYNPNYKKSNKKHHR